MPSNSETILTLDQHTGDSSVETAVGEKFKGDGYYGRSDGFHSVQYNLIGFIGAVEMQATLALDPIEQDWFSVAGTTHVSNSTETDASDGGHIYNFTGNYVWVRAKVYNWTDGTVASIYLNH